ncbi:RDD family protein [Limnohabitans sp. T6-20]|uniref:RDD family protein n=1 Tax=Limnohabitans sp. T6-20 TaxID=1100725 RepID=UPI0021082207|nr:RDD family protein [Limnohabitans sp. T6-20]
MTQRGATSSPTPNLCAPPLIRRMACWLYEGMLLFGVMVTAGLAYFIAAYWLTGLAPGEMNIHPQLKSGLQAISFLVLGIYFTWFWHRGQTLAMKTWRIQIVDPMGHRLNRKTAFKRYIASWLWFIPPIAATAPFHLPATEVGLLSLGWVLVWALLSRLHPERQFWHDAWAGTRLVSVD